MAWVAGQLPEAETHAVAWASHQRQRIPNETPCVLSELSFEYMIGYVEGLGPRVDMSGCERETVAL